MIERQTINALFYADAKLFLSHLRELQSKHEDHVYFRGQTNDDWPLLPTACRGSNNVWTEAWIESFVSRHRLEYVRFLKFKRSNENLDAFNVRFELALRHFIEGDIIYQFQQYASSKNIISLSAHERVPEVTQQSLLHYLEQEKIPLAAQIRYVSLLAQHHGVPTRLLDWTSSLDVALDFAARFGIQDASEQGRIAVWVFVNWESRPRSSATVEGEARLGGTLTQEQTGESEVDYSQELGGMPSSAHDFLAEETQRTQSVFISQGIGPSPLQYAGEFATRFERSIHSTGLKLLDPLGVSQHDIYVAAQRSSAMVDIYHDRRFSCDHKWQHYESRLLESKIPRDKVFKFMLPHSELDYLRAIADESKVPRIYSTPMFEEFGSIDPDSDTFEHDLNQRKHKFLSEVGNRITRDIEWDSLTNAN